MSFEAAETAAAEGNALRPSKLIHECSIQAHVSRLPTDDELMLFDALFDAWDTLESPPLKTSVFHAIFRIPTDSVRAP
jgi:hypothetical protein